MEDKTIILKLELQAAAAKANVKKLTNEISNMDKRTLEAKEKMSKLALEIDKVGNLKVKIKELKSEVEGLDKGMKGASAATGSASASVLEMGRVISDSNYGIRGVANNLSQLASNMVYTAKAAGGFAAGLRSIWSAMMGPLGILLAIQGAIALLERWSMSTDNATKKTEEWNNEMKSAYSTIVSNTAKLEVYAKVYKDTNSSINAQTNALKELKSLGFDPLTTVIDDFIDKQKELIILQATAGVFKKQLEKLVEARTQANDLIVEANQKLTKSVNDLDRARKVRDEAEKISNKTSITNSENVYKAEKRYQDALSEVNELTEARGNIFLNIKDKGEEYKKLLEDILDLETGKKPKGKKGTGKKSKYGGYFDEDFEERIEAYKKRYKEYTEDIRAIEAEIDIASFVERNGDSISGKSKLVEMEMNEELARVDFLIGLRKEENEGYADLEAEKTLIRKQAQIARGEIDRLETENKREMYDNIGSILSSASDLAGKNTASGKALAVAGTTISTYSAAQKAYESQMTLTPDSPIRAQLAAAVAIAKGLANVKSILAVKIPNQSSTGSSPSAGRTFDFNLVGSTGQNQLAQTIGGQVSQPIKAYVVSSEITNQQQFDSQIQGQTTIG